MANEVENIGVSSFQTGLALAINQTFSYANNSYFYAIIPYYYRDYALRYIKPSLEWLDGYVRSLHNSASGIISTRIASKLITGLTKQIVGEQLVFKLNSKKSEESMETLNFVSKWAKEKNILKAVYSGIGWALASGTSLLKANMSADGQVWWEASRIDQCFYLTNFQNEVQEATFLIRNYIDTRTDKNTSQFFLVEHRFWQTYEQGKIDENLNVIHKKGDKVPMVEYQVHRVAGTTNNNLNAVNMGKTSIGWDELPKEIRKMIRNDYGVIRINEPKHLGFVNLGVVPLLNGNIDLGVPTGTNFGESMIVGIQDDLIQYELASAYQIRDMYYGKGTLYLPKSLSMGDLTPMDVASGGHLIKANPMNAMPDGAIEMLKGVNPDEQKAFTEQFSIRVQEWQLAKENACKNIALKWGMSPKILASFLSTGSVQMTATQIDSEDDMSMAFISHTRAYFKTALNSLLETTLNAYGYPSNINLDFASPSLLNKDRLLDRTLKMREAGLIDLDDAIRIMNPDLDEEGIQAKIDAAKKEQERQIEEQLTEMNAMGEFGNNYDDLGGANLNGSTLPRQ